MWVYEHLAPQWTWATQEDHHSFRAPWALIWGFVGAIFQLSFFLYSFFLLPIVLPGIYPKSTPLKTFCTLVSISEFASWRIQPVTVGARRGRKLILRWNFGAPSPAAWVAMRTSSLAVDSCRCRPKMHCNCSPFHWWWTEMVYQWKEVHWGAIYQAFEKYGAMVILKTMELDGCYWR